MRPLQARIALLAALALGAPSLAADASPRPLARSARDGTSLAVVAGSASVEVRDGARRTALSPPRGARVDAVARLGGGWLVAGSAPTLDGRQELWLARGGEGGVTAVDSPAGAAPLRVNSVLLAEGSELAGMAWLEGADRRRLAVRFAAWTGAGFAPPVTVAPPGRGSQLALAGARLADGHLLLVWAGFDGEDDEIWASVGEGELWTPPARVGGENRVPDITPDATPLGSGAAVAWSRFDGSEYEVVVSRFEGGRFGAPRPVAGPGSLYPTFETDGARTGLLFQDARRRGWTVLELGDDGAPGRIGRVRKLGDGRPLVRLGDRGVEWEFAAAVEATAWE